MTEENSVLEDKKLSSQKEYLRLLPELKDAVVREQELFNLIKRVGRNAGYAKHEIRYDMMRVFVEAGRVIDEMDKMK